MHFQCSMCVWCWPSLIFIGFGGHIQSNQKLAEASCAVMSEAFKPELCDKMATGSSSSKQVMEPQPKARAQTGQIKSTGVGSWTKAWNLAEAGDVTKFFHLGVKKFIFDSDEASLHKRWRDHHGMKDTKWHDQLRKLELEQPLFHIQVPTGKTKHWSLHHKFTHANPWLQAMLSFSRALQKRDIQELLVRVLASFWGAMLGFP